MASQESIKAVPPRVAHVEREWLKAAKDGDVDRMKILSRGHPERLDLNRNIGVSSEDSANGSEGLKTSRFCSWDGFHLSTIGASVLHTATWHGDEKVMEYLLEEGQAPDSGDDSGMTAVMLAIMRHNLQATRCIFKGRVAVQRNLVLDCREEDAERVQSTLGRIQLLLRFGADPNKRCHSAKTALHHATTDEAYEVAKLLVENGANVDAKDADGRSPLHHCIQSSSLQVANLLLQQRAQLHVQDNDGVTPLGLVIRTEDVNMLQVMLNHHQLVPTPLGEDFAGSVLMTAVDEGSLSVVEFLLEEGYAELCYQNVKGETPMHRALLKQKPDVAELLWAIDERAELLGLCTLDGEGCFHYAARYSTPADLQLLLAWYRRQREQRPLGDASAEECEEASMLVLNLVNYMGRTALFLAATSATDSLDERNTKAELLLDAGAMLLGGSPFLESSSSRMAFSTEVQRCLSLWLAESAKDHVDHVTRFCITYLAIISSSDYTQLGVNHEVLGVLLSSGYTVDTVPLLILQPFDRRASLALLQHLGLFSRQHNHPLLLALYEEFVAAWTGLN